MILKVTAHRSLRELKLGRRRTVDCKVYVRWEHPMAGPTDLDSSTHVATINLGATRARDR